MDTAYISKENGGCLNQSLLTFMEELALDKNNVHFSHLKYPKIGGMTTTTRTSYTLGSTFGALCGVPYMGDNSIHGQSEGYLNELNCIGELLNSGGYITSSTFGCPFNDWGYGNIFSLHHFHRVNSLRDFVKFAYFWLRDYITYEHFKKELTSLYNPNRPFFAFFSTLDTHEPGHICKLCPPGDNDMLRSAKCADNQIKNFMSWAKLQPWYNNTVILIFGDHPTRDIRIRRIADENHYSKTSYNVFINSEISSNNTHERLFTSFDLMPTILAAAGIKIKGDRLGVGVNILSDEKTNYEVFGEKFIDSLSDSSFWYDSAILQKPTQCDGYIPCITIENCTGSDNFSILN